MLSLELIKEQLKYTLHSTSLPHLGPKLSGKVRDCYVLGDKRVIIATDRLSAFDVVLSTVPFKGQLLNQMAAYWFTQTKHIVPNHVLAQPHPNVMLVQEVEIIPIEIVVRAYLAGSAWRDYKAGRTVSGIRLPKGLKESERLEKPIITPSTKAEQNLHDEPISSEEILYRGIVGESLWSDICRIALKLFEFGSAKATERGLILVDTKYEFGIAKNEAGQSKLVIADELHTPDSSRYWMLDTYWERFDQSRNPQMLDKETLRQWLIEQGFMGIGPAPQLTEELRIETAVSYIEAYQKITASEFEATVGPVEEQIKQFLSGL